MTYRDIIVEIDEPIAIVQFNRPKALNALCHQLMEELSMALKELDENEAIGAIVLTGDDRAFAAGADITEIKDATFQHMLTDGGLTRYCDSISSCRTPIIAAVAGYALGGGCELAMMCDFIIAADNAKFGQPEVTIGTMPGFGGSQRLTSIVGKSKAMDMCLTGRMMDAAEAERSGLASRVLPLAQYRLEAISAAKTIAHFSRPVVGLIKDAVDLSLETPLAQGLKSEQDMFKSTFALDDQTEGMTAFAEKRKPDFKNR
ncbi:MAG: enoyl-CoA hydratase [Gammaproteobacteria bacterium]|jgi:enoyl-CoA hydratase